MRLLHASNLTMHEFYGDNIPEYAILSHRWENEEVTFQDFRDGKGPKMAGWSKVTGCCAQAMLDGWEYVVSYLSIFLEGSDMNLFYTIRMSWDSKTFQANHKLYQWIDSCCIDKSSSAELSEAINSMFRWYEESQVCYAYLSDVRNASEDPSSRDSDFLMSKWFTRGWTLQELLAPHCKQLIK
jgi:hypothetical protein